MRPTSPTAAAADGSPRTRRRRTPSPKFARKKGRTGDIARRTWTNGEASGGRAAWLAAERAPAAGGRARPCGWRPSAAQHASSWLPRARVDGGQARARGGGRIPRPSWSRAHLEVTAAGLDVTAAGEKMETRVTQRLHFFFYPRQPSLMGWVVAMGQVAPLTSRQRAHRTPISLFLL